MIPALLLMLAPVELAPGEPKPVVTTIAAIRASPQKFDGQVVRLTGYVNACVATCSLDERAASAPGGAGAGLTFDPNKQFDDVVRPLLPTYVEFDARFSAGCDASQVCLDGLPHLDIVSVRGIVSTQPPPFQD
jgi:hypothetical protein